MPNNFAIHSTHDLITFQLRCERYDKKTPNSICKGQTPLTELLMQ